MTLEQKLSLLIGFALSLTLGVLISDHVSRGAGAQLATEASNAPAPTPPVIAWVDTPDRPSADAPERRFASSKPGPAREPLPTREQLVEEPEPVRVAEAPKPRFHFRLPPEASPTYVPVSERPETRADSTPAGDGVAVHHVVSGESLFSICKAYYGNGHLWRALATFNEGRLGSDGTLRVGVAIRVPPLSVLRDLPDASAVAIAEPEPDEMGEYVVKRGDTLGEISYKLLGTSRKVDELLRLNADVIRNPNMIRQGTVLRYPLGPDA